MFSQVGVNILAQYVHDKPAMMNWLDALNPSAVVVMDDLNMASSIKIMLPECRVIHRSWHPNDHRWHEIMTPADLVNSYRPLLRPGIITQVFNEPSGYSSLAQLTSFVSDVCHRFRDIGADIAVPNFGVGHPDLNELAAGRFDSMFRAIDDSEQFFATHEYSTGLPSTEYPWKIGRIVTLSQRYKLVTGRNPRVVITEYGRDVGGGQNDGWRSVMDENSYYNFLKNGLQFYKSLYIPACIFCYGTGGNGSWSSFDIQTASTLKNRLINERLEMPAEVILPSGSATPVSAVVSTMPGTYVNIRSGPATTYQDIGDLPVGSMVTYYPSDVRNGWVFVVFGSIGGWVSLQSGAVVFEVGQSVEVLVEEMQSIRNHAMSIVNFVNGKIGV